MPSYRIEDFYNTLQEHHIILSDFQKQQFQQYAQLLIEWNKKINLTAILNIDEIYEKHFLDSILPFLNMEIIHLCDVGAGAGFPSIPLKIIYPNLQVTILEPLQKRIMFLEVLCQELALHHVTCLHERAEDYAKSHREVFDVVTARAVANLSILAELCIPLVKEHGYFIAMKGMQGLIEYEKAHHAIALLGCELNKEDTIKLSDGSTRINLYFKKIKKTSNQFPRSFAKIKKEPL